MNLGFLLFPNVTQLDFTGPLQVLSRAPGARVHIAAKSLDPVPSDCGLSLLPTTTLERCPALDVLCIPGGFGVDDVVLDRDTLDWVRSQAARATYVTSVCTGAFVLGAAGLLDGVKATTHWAYHHLLPRVGAVPVRARVVRDGRVFTGGGVTAGIDFAFTLLSEIAGESSARATQLGLEYDPQPPFASGSPALAGPELVETLQHRYATRVARFEDILASARPPR